MACCWVAELSRRKLSRNVLRSSCVLSHEGTRHVKGSLGLDTVMDEVFKLVGAPNGGPLFVEWRVLPQRAFLSLRKPRLICSCGAVDGTV